MKTARLVFLLFAIAFSISQTACEKKSKAEKAFDDFSEKTKEAGEDIKEAGEETGKETKKQSKKTKKKLKEIFK